MSSGITGTFAKAPCGAPLSQCTRHVTHALLTRSPLTALPLPSTRSVRLACLSHAASVRSEPGSNSSVFIRCFGTAPRHLSVSNRGPGASKGIVRDFQGNREGFTLTSSTCLRTQRLNGSRRGPRRIPRVTADRRPELARSTLKVRFISSTTSYHVASPYPTFSRHSSHCSLVKERKTISP